MSHPEFDRLTPYELDRALEDHSQYHFAYDKLQMQLIRHVGVVLRNKGLKTAHQIRDPLKFFKFPWEIAEKVHVPTKEEWEALDRKYNRK